MNERINLDGGTHLLVLTGAGVSAESGIPTFRDANGLWENHAVEKVASPEGFNEDPALVWRFYSQRRSAAVLCNPNPGHQALVEVERRLQDRFLLVTQNVDGLHLRAGSKRVVELHGNLFTSRCSGCSRPPFPDPSIPAPGEVPLCDLCGAGLRPDIVWFGEALAAESMQRITRFMSRASGVGRWVFLAAGTSGQVYPAAGLVDAATRLGAESWLVNADPAANGDSFEHFVRGKSGTVLPSLFATQA